jgi:hypothetical protein
MTISETAMPSEQSGSIGSNLRNTLPLVGLVVALILTAAWIGLLGYCFLTLI